MTRQAARAGFETFVDDAITITAEEFSVARALRRGTRGPGGKAVDQLLKNSDAVWERVVRPELNDYRDQILTQFDVVLEYVEDDAPIDAYREELLAVDSYAEALREDVNDDRRQEIQDRLVERQRRLGEAVEPLVAATESEFWPAVETTFDREEAAQLVEEHFAFTGPLQEERRAFRMETTFDPTDVLGSLGALFGGLASIEVEYTDEALRAMRRAERRVISDATDELDQRYV